MTEINTETTEVPEVIKPTDAEIQELIKQRDEAKALAEKNKTDLTNVVEELQRVRKERTVSGTSTESIDIDTVVNEAIAKKEMESLAKRKDEIFKKFLETRKEFDPQYDITGLRLQALKQKLNRFNINSVSSEDEYLNILNDAASLTLGKDTTNGNQSVASPSIVNPGSSQPYQPSNPTGMTREEKEMATRLGWDEKKFNSMKAKFPTFVSQMINQ